MGPELIFLLLALVGLLSFSDMGSNTDTDEAEDPADPEPAVLRGTSGDDLLIGDGGLLIRGLQGDDTLVTTGGDTLYGGQGNDTLVAMGGGGILFGGPGEDAFVIDVRGVGADGTLQDARDVPVAPTVVGDFNPDTDRLVIDLRQGPLAAGPDNPVTLTGTPAPDGEGLMVQVNGVDVVQLSTYGGGDMQGALEALAEDFDALEVVGAEYTFPDPEGDNPPEDMELPGTLIEPGLSQQPDESDDFREPTYYLNNDYAGDGLIAERAAIDLTLYQGDLSVTIDENGTVLIEDANDDGFSLTLASVTRISIGEGQNTVDASASGAFVSVYVASFGAENTIIGGSGPTTILSFAGGADIQVGSGATVVQAYSGNDTIIGGIGSLEVYTADNGNAFVSDAFGEITNLFQAGPTMIEAVDAAVSGIIGVGDTLALGEGPNNIVVYGLSPADLGPAVITGFDPDPSGFNSFEYVGVFSELEPDGGPPAPTAVLEERGDDLFVVENGRDMVRFVNLSLADVQGMPADRFDLSQNFFSPVNA